MIDSTWYENAALRGGLRIVRLGVSDIPLLDAIGREAIAKTRIVGRDLEITIRSGLSDDEFSVTLYHEILEAATIASANPPASVLDFNEASFERAAYAAYAEYGAASVENLNRMLQSHGFPEH